MNPNQSGQGPIKVNLDQLQANMRSAETELALWQRRLDAMVERGTQEALHIEAFCKSQGYIVAAPYLRAIKTDYEAQADMIRLQTAKLQSQIEIMKAMKAEAESMVSTPKLFI
jgi:hypothetical protein